MEALIKMPFRIYQIEKVILSININWISDNPRLKLSISMTDIAR
jgi:hypothetical protein